MYFFLYSNFAQNVNKTLWEKNKSTDILNAIYSGEFWQCETQCECAIKRWKQSMKNKRILWLDIYYLLNRIPMQPQSA